MKEESSDEFSSGIEVHLRTSGPINHNLVNRVFVFTAIYLEQVEQAARRFHAKLQKPTDYEINSHLVTLDLEVEDRIASNKFSYLPADKVSTDHEYLFSIEFNFLNNSFNRTERKVWCAEIFSGEFPNLRPTAACNFMYSNRSGVSLPTCTCARKGTYGLLVSKPPSETSGVLVFGVSRPVVYGCLISLILSILTWVLLLKTYFNISNKLITGLKVYHLLCIDYNTYQVHTQDLFYLSSLKFKFSGIKKYIYVKLG